MGDIELQTFADRLKELRSDKGLTQAQFIEDLGITASALSSYEKNLKNPSISVAKRIAEKYNVSIDWLCGLSDKKHNTEEIETYSDLFKILFEIVRHTPITLDYIPIFSNGFNPSGDIITIQFNDELIDNFLEEWKKMKSLHDEKVIDDDVYNLWIEKIMIKPDHLQKLKKAHQSTARTPTQGSNEM